MKLSTICGHEKWAGFFGINENGDQPECTEEIEIDVEEDCIIKEDGYVRPAFSVECPGCGVLLEWPQEWEIVAVTSTDTKPQKYVVTITGTGTIDECNHVMDLLLQEPPEHPLKDLADNQKDMPPEFSKVVDDNFFDLV